MQTRTKIVTLAILIIFNTLFSFKTSIGSECDEKLAEETYESVPLDEFSFFVFDANFTRGDRTVLPSYKNFTNAEELNEDPDRIGTQPIVRAVADFNLDGFDDIIVAFHETNQLTAVMYSDGKGRFDLSWLPEASRTRLLREVNIADFDQDGRPDIYGHTAPHDWKNNKGAGGDAEPDFLILNKSEGLQSIDIEKITNGNNHQGAIADLNNDGYLDIVSFDQRTKISNRLKTILYNDGNNNFKKGSQLPNSITNNPYYDVEAGDLNGDGLIDLVFSRENYQTNKKFPDKQMLLVLMNNKDGIENGEVLKVGKPWFDKIYWDSYKTYLSCLEKKEKYGKPKQLKIKSGEIALFDYDNDGDLDIFYTQQLATNFSNKKVRERGSALSVLNNQYPNFIDVTEEVIPFQPVNRIHSNDGLGPTRKIYFEDINNDNQKDLILSNFRTNKNRQYPFIFLNKMNKFHPVSKSNMGNLEFRSQLIPLDLNGDGNIDFVSTRYAKRGIKKFVFDTFLFDGESQ